MAEQIFRHDTFISPFTWRYGSREMRHIWSEEHKRRLLRRFWTALARAEMKAGIVTPEQVEDLEKAVDSVDIPRAAEIEAEIQHDLMAEIRTFAEQCPVGGSIIHLGATSMDALDNVDAVRLNESLDIINLRLVELTAATAEKIREYAFTPCMAFTHIQPAEPTTIGYRLAQYGQDLGSDLEELQRVRSSIRGKGLKGAVGTSASYTELLKGTGMKPAELESLVMDELGIKPFTAATQVYPRKQDAVVLTALSNLALTLYRMAFDFRLLQSPPFGEVSEPFGSRQVGSSAMPFKRNPIKSEKVNSLARFLSTLPAVAWHNAAHSLLERTLDDSANRRELLPAAFLSADELLTTMNSVISGLHIHMTAVNRNMEVYGVFAATERILMELGRRGADRQAMHEVIREHSLAAWADLQAGKENTLPNRLCGDARITDIIDAKEAAALLDASEYIGDAGERAIAVAQELESLLTR
jgi:adenylosuccinate lyase